MENDPGPPSLPERLLRLIDSAIVEQFQSPPSAFFIDAFRGRDIQSTFVEEIFSNVLKGHDFLSQTNFTAVFSHRVRAGMCLKFELHPTCAAASFAYRRR